MTQIGCEMVLREGAERGLYRSPCSNRPKWMRGRSDEVRISRTGVRYIRSIGWELRPENRRYTTCPRYVEVRTEWRH